MGDNAHLLPMPAQPQPPPLPSQTPPVGDHASMQRSLSDMQKAAQQQQQQHQQHQRHLLQQQYQHQQLQQQHQQQFQQFHLQQYHQPPSTVMPGTVAISDMQPLGGMPTLEPNAQVPLPAAIPPESRKRKWSAVPGAVGEGKYLATETSLKRLLTVALVVHGGWTANAACQEMGINPVSFSKRKWVKRYKDANETGAANAFAEVLGERRGGARSRKKGPFEHSGSEDEGP